LAGDYILNYYDLCIFIIITFLTFMINPFIMFAMGIQYASATLTCVDYPNNTTISNIRNCELLHSHFHRVDLFSELSRNMTPTSSSSSSSSSSSDLFADAENIGKEDTESNAEADDLQDETTTGQANESLSSSPSSPSYPSNIFEDTKETEEGQDDAESNADDNIQEQDATTSEKSPEDNDNTIDSQLTNST
jgi:hypothetical protein